MEAAAALVGSDGAVALDAEAAVDVDVAVVALVGDTEGDDALGLDDPLEDAALHIVGPALDDGLERFENLDHRLVELGLLRIALLDVLEHLDGLWKLEHPRVSSRSPVILASAPRGGLPRERPRLSS